jgi:hypothetical protein
MNPARDSIARLAIRLGQYTGKEPPSPRILYDRVLRGIIPAQWVHGRWLYFEKDIPAIAEALEMVEPGHSAQQRAARERNAIAETLS